MTVSLSSPKPKRSFIFSWTRWTETPLLPLNALLPFFPPPLIPPSPFMGSLRQPFLEEGLNFSEKTNYFFPHRCTFRSTFGAVCTEVSDSRSSQDYSYPWDFTFFGERVLFKVNHAFHPRSPFTRMRRDFCFLRHFPAAACDPFAAQRELCPFSFASLLSRYFYEDCESDGTFTPS